MAPVKSLFSPPKTPSVVQAAPSAAAAEAATAPAPSPPTVDDAKVAAEQEAEVNKRKGRLANVLTPSSTSAQLGGSPQPSLKRALGA